MENPRERVAKFRKGVDVLGKEILEAAEIAMVFGGGPTLAAAATMLVDALDEFEKDYKPESGQ